MFSAICTAAGYAAALLSGGANIIDAGAKLEMYGQERMRRQLSDAENTDAVAQHIFLVAQGVDLANTMFGGGAYSNVATRAFTGACDIARHTTHPIAMKGELNKEDKCVIAAVAIGQAASSALLVSQQTPWICCGYEQNVSSLAFAGAHIAPAIKNSANIQAMGSKLYSLGSKFANRMQSYASGQAPVAQGQVPLVQQEAPAALGLPFQEQENGADAHEQEQEEALPVHGPLPLAEALQGPDVQEQLQQEPELPIAPVLIPQEQPQAVIPQLLPIKLPEGFLEWFEQRPEAQHFLCPASGAFLFYPVRCLYDGNLAVELSYVRRLQDLGQESIIIHGDSYLLQDFDSAIDTTRQAANREALSSFLDDYEGYLANSQEESMVQLMEALHDMESLRSVPDIFLHIKELKKCRISGRPIRFVVVPNTRDVRNVYYERETLEDWITSHPNEAPRGWPTESLPWHLLKKSDIKPQKRTQETIDEILREAIKDFLGPIHDKRCLLKQFA
jgi:hypothetical protein